MLIIKLESQTSGRFIASDYSNPCLIPMIEWLEEIFGTTDLYNQLTFLNSKIFDIYCYNEIVISKEKKFISISFPLLDENLKTYIPKNKFRDFLFIVKEIGTFKNNHTVEAIIFKFDKNWTCTVYYEYWKPELNLILFPNAQLQQKTEASFMLFFIKQLFGKENFFWEDSFLGDEEWKHISYKKTLYIKKEQNIIMLSDALLKNPTIEIAIPKPKFAQLLKVLKNNDYLTTKEYRPKEIRFTFDNEWNCTVTYSDT